MGLVLLTIVGIRLNRNKTSHKIDNKYPKDSDFLSYKIKGGDSFTWKGVVRSLREVEPCIVWRIGTGKDISLWKDHWMGKEPLIKSLEGEINEDELDLTVADIIDENGSWNCSYLRTEIPITLWQEIIKLPRPLDRNRKDKRVWCGTSNGLFSCKSAYKCINREKDMTGASWDWLWKFKCSERIRYFIWTSLHNSLATNKLRYERKIASSNLCPRCNTHEESIIHALRDCATIKGVWEFAITPTHYLEFSQLDPSTWFKDNITKAKFTNILLPDIEWCIMFAALVWSIWKSRNKEIFHNIRDPVKVVILAAKKLADDLSRIGTKKICSKICVPELVKWKKPNVGWHKINTDGSVFTELRSAAAGGLIRDDHGRWVTGFSRSLGDVSITYAELLAAREGLNLAWVRRFPRIILEIDSEVVIQLIREAEISTHPLGCIIEDCRNLLRKPWESRVIHTKRDGNSCADTLAKMGHRKQGVWDEAPMEILALLSEDLE